MLLQLMKTSLAYILAVTLIICSLLLNGLFGFLTQFRKPNNEKSLSLQLQHTKPPYPAGSFDNIWWFVQVTDLHISEHVQPQIAPDLIAWCEQMHEIIKPEFVLVTGDLTDAKAKNQIQSFQIESEWMRYKHVRDTCHENIVSKNKASQPEPWIDIRGNHDSFNVDLKGGSSKVSKFLATTYNSVTHFTVVKPFGEYLFIGVDFSPQPGPARPLNFFGFYNATRDNPKLSALITSGQSANLTFMYGHHTLNVVTSAENFFARMRYGSVYLCGHLHALLEWKSTQHLYGYHHDASILELELADFQKNRRFRVVAIDHDLMSFTDVSFHQWPVVVITCPKHAQYLVPGKEPIGKMMLSSHIRLLVFSVTAVNRVHVEIARETSKHNTLWNGDASNAYGALYTLKWNPKSFSQGQFIIRVIATDDFGNQQTVEQPFSLDGSASPLPPVASFIIASNLSKAAKVLFWTAHVCFLTCLLLLKTRLAFLRKMNVFRVPVVGLLLENLLVYISCDNLFKPLLLWQLWTAHGPWFIGRLLSEKWALVFVNGVYFLDGTFLPSGLNHVFGLFHLAMFDIPMVLIISYLLRASNKNGDCAFPKLARKKSSASNLIKRRLLLFIALILLIWQSHKSFEVYLNYGLIAVLSNIVEFYCIFLYIYQLHFAMRYRSRSQ